MADDREQGRRLLGRHLSAALTMEDESVRLLAQLTSVARSLRLKDVLEEHRHETCEQIDNLEKACLLLGLAARRSPMPPVSLFDDGCVAGTTAAGSGDWFVVTAALGGERYEISAYQGLMLTAEVLGAAEIRVLVELNLRQERRASAALLELARAAMSTTGAAL